jgi:3-oxocholest-4-en-26-oyl-CoA dehydrogenase beta subunit
MAIDLNLNEEQALLQKTARDFFTKNCPPALVRSSQNCESEFPRDLWRKMADLGLLGISFPEQYEGQGCSFLYEFALYVELGRCLAPVPHLNTIALAGELVATLGTEKQKAAILPAIARGESILSFAPLEPEGLFGPGGVALSAEGEGDGFKLNGTKVLVPNVKTADWLICPVRTGSKMGIADGVSLFLVDSHAPGVFFERVPNMAGHALYAVTLKDVMTTHAHALGALGEAWPYLHATMQRAAVLQAAMVVGAGERLLEMSVEYAKERVQFRTPVGRNQSVQNLAIDIASHGHATWLLALRAAWLIDTGRPFVREASLAKAAASRAAAAMTSAAHEVHAGIGFMVDYDLQLYTHCAKHWEFNLGDARYHLEQIMEHTKEALMFESPEAA